MTWDQKAAMKGVHWELAKGHLRALVAIDGAMHSAQLERPLRFEEVSDAIEGFIKDFEDNALHE
jgi:uncharacterized protein involved in outer membrane biogenesis